MAEDQVSSGFPIPRMILWTPEGHHISVYWLKISPPARHGEETMVGGVLGLGSAGRRREGRAGCPELGLYDPF